ncbi:MAG TPA: hypothetical protein VFB52_01600, partial [Solirubrobacterales bacterium]|nr:hypothetical protein [Solirubrobacterales bacterium]
GISAAANVAAALRLASRLEEGVIVTILCDDGSKYLSENFWEEGDQPSAVSGQPEGGPGLAES